MVNGNVSNKDLFKYLTDLRIELKEDIKDVKDDVNAVEDRIDDLVVERGKITERITAVETDNKNLSRRAGAWDIGNSAGVLVAGILAYFGIRN